MARYQVVADRTHIDITLRPGLPDLRVRVTDVAGRFDGELLPDGGLDLTKPVTGRIDLELAGLHTNNRLLATGLEHLLDGASEAKARVDVLGARGHAPGTYAFMLVATVADRDANLVGTGRLDHLDDGQLGVVGQTRCDPRNFGAPLPPLVNLVVIVRWRLRLRPD